MAGSTDRSKKCRNRCSRRVASGVEYVPVFAADFGVVSELNAEVARSFVSIEGAMANLEAEATLIRLTRTEKLQNMPGTNS